MKFHPATELNIHAGEGPGQGILRTVVPRGSPWIKRSQLIYRILEEMACLNCLAFKLTCFTSLWYYFFYFIFSLLTHRWLQEGARYPDVEMTSIPKKMFVRERGASGNWLLKQTTVGSKKALCSWLEIFWIYLITFPCRVQAVTKLPDEIIYGSEYLQVRLKPFFLLPKQREKNQEENKNKRSCLWEKLNSRIRNMTIFWRITAPQNIKCCLKSIWTNCTGFNN